MNALMKKDTDFKWGANENKAFESVRKALASPPVLAVFDVNKPTVVSADSSSYGLGAVLLQEQPDKTMKPVAYASRSLTPAERRYAQIEKEALAISWACERFKDFILGLHIRLETDHRPLLAIMKTKQLDELSPRLQRFRMKLMRYSYDIVYTPGKDLLAADALSRNPLPDTSDETSDEAEIDAQVDYVVGSIPASDDTLSKIFSSQQNDPQLKMIMEFVQKGWPAKEKIDPQLKPYFQIRDELTVQNGLLMRGIRLVIPSALQFDMLSRIHNGHLGITKCRARAQQSVWWPGVSAQIKQMIEKCVVCVKYRRQNKEPLMPSDFPSRPWERVGLDLFHYSGKWYLLVTDYFSRYPEVAKLDSLTSQSVIQHLKSIFARHGIPDELRSDNGPRFEPMRTREFADFAKDYGFKHVSSSPRFPQSNGFVEAMVKVIKSGFKKNADIYKMLLEYRATPLENGYSPAELLMSRKLKTTLPKSPDQLHPQVVSSTALLPREGGRIEKQKKNFDRRHAVKDQGEFKPGEVVWVKDRRTWGKVKEAASTPRSYIVSTPRGEYRRNSSFLTRAYREDIPEHDVLPQLAEPEVPVQGPPPQNNRRARRPANPVPVREETQPYVTRRGRTVKQHVPYQHVP